MPVFSLLADPEGYTPCSTENMLVDDEYREYWLRHFEQHFESVVRSAIANYGEAAAPRAHACRDDLVKTLHAIRAKPDLLGRLDLLVLDMVRQNKLIEHGIPDPFEKTKARENAAMLPAYPQIVGELDSHSSDEEALLLATEGVFAGNIFDLGAAATTKLFAHESPDFLKVRAQVGQKRPWLVDHFDAMQRRLLSRVHRQAMFFVDNAGSDFILGALPFARLLAKRGTRVLLAANDLPALNDMTHRELLELLPRLQAVDATLDQLVKSGRMIPINSGDGAPLIDLAQVSEEVNRYASETDLVILEGMGRAVESNYEAKFKVDAIKLAMLKEEITARRLGGKIFDTVCRLDVR